jgi:16S rRNA (guanine(966)-N(2))-methyltransferase RsmD
MRIISGKHKGRKIIAPKQLPVRPTTDRSKEALFNIIQHRFEFSQIQVLDLYAGTGNISYEFASRGAAQITAVDQNRFCIQFIQKTTAGLELNITAVKEDSQRFIEQNENKYDLIFADPPYEFQEKSYEILADRSQYLLKPEGLFILEHYKKIKLNHLKGFDFERVYGNNIFSFFAK